MTQTILQKFSPSENKLNPFSSLHTHKKKKKKKKQKNKKKKNKKKKTTKKQITWQIVKIQIAVSSGSSQFAIKLRTLFATIGVSKKQSHFRNLGDKVLKSSKENEYQARSLNQHTGQSIFCLFTCSVNHKASR